MKKLKVRQKKVKKYFKNYLTLVLSFKRDLNSRIRFGPYIEQPHFEKKFQKGMLKKSN
jgi:hypothetical protein